MNCKQGDLAIMVRSAANNEGKIFWCVRFAPLSFWMRKDGSIRVEAAWLVDPPARSFDGFIVEHLADSDLRPIRGGEGADEMLRIVGKPRHILEEA